MGKITNINHDGSINLLVSSACRWWTATVLWAFFFNPRLTNFVVQTYRNCANSTYYKDLKRMISAKSEAWRVDAHEVKIVKTIGKGAYGTVLLGTYGNTKVAVKNLQKQLFQMLTFWPN